MTDAKEQFDAATEAVREHELKHVGIQRQFNASQAKLEILNRVASDAWRVVLAELEQGISK